MQKWHARCLILIWIVCTMCCFSGCGIFSNDSDDDTVVIVPDDGETVDSDTLTVQMPEASGTTVYSKNGVLIDASNTDDGYIMVKYTGETDSSLKVRVTLGSDSYTYDLNNQGDYEVYPLQMVNGTYSVKAYKSIEGTAYTVLYSVSFDVDMDDTDRVFVFPNQYVWYTNDSEAIAKSQELCEDATTDREKAQIIYRFVSKTIKYDYEKAETVQAGYIPDVDEILETKKGICFDYAALLGAMLRAQDIPTRLVIGYVSPENYYHAWNQVYIDGEWVWMDPTFGSYDSHDENDYTEDRRY